MSKNDPNIVTQEKNVPPLELLASYALVESRKQSLKEAEVKLEAIKIRKTQLQKQYQELTDHLELAQARLAILQANLDYMLVVQKQITNVSKS